MRHPSHLSNVPYSYVSGRFLGTGRKSDKVRKQLSQTERVNVATDIWKARRTFSVKQLARLTRLEVELLGIILHQPVTNLELLAELVTYAKVYAAHLKHFLYAVCGCPKFVIHTRGHFQSKVEQVSKA